MNTMEEKTESLIIKDNFLNWLKSADLKDITLNMKEKENEINAIFLTKIR